MGGVGEVADHPVARSHTEVAQGGRDGGDLGAQLPARDLAARSGLVQRGDRGRVRVQVAQRVVRVVEGGAGEPAGAGHGLHGQHTLVRSGRVDLEVLPHGRPETFQVGD
ncbi:hypothetical protein GCM10018980_23220 [Streptomyces capoamus]|uniref:Uncharacterized protein n=1 Tax=Streptomyces capoamus TaxID=68183 RepID=A0A919C497_9ACTN|nr:hypothetical protein GCM10010501_00660 [Streptomyces libani subsp. rufus]GHG44896.1 hypothetical protein GCM10018980_23220 [Streptomyces capoamus]